MSRSRSAAWVAARSRAVAEKSAPVTANRARRASRRRRPRRQPASSAVPGARSAVSATSVGLALPLQARDWERYRSSHASSPHGVPGDAHRAVGLRGDQVGVDRRPRREPGGRRRNHLSHRIAHVAGHPQPGTVVAPVRSASIAMATTCSPIRTGCGSNPSGSRKSARATGRGATASASSSTRSPSASRTPVRPAGPDLDLDDLALHDRDRACGQLFALLRGQRGGVRKQRHLIAQLPEQQRLMRRHRPGGQHADAPVADLPAVAVRAVHHVAAPVLRQPGHLGQFVDEPGRHQQPAGPHRPRRRARSGTARPSRADSGHPCLARPDRRTASPRPGRAA